MAPCGCGGGGAERCGAGGAALCALAVVGYAALGATLFGALEGGGAGGAGGAGEPDGGAAGAASLRARAVDRLWAITEDLNILYRDNWTRLAARELREFERALTAHAARAPPAAPAAPRRAHTHRWSFAGSFLYALSLITTIGPGEGWAVSGAGRCAGAVYAAGGIPLVLAYLAAAGGAGGAGVRALWARLRRAPRPPPAPPDKPPPTPFQAALNLCALPPRAAAPAPRVPAAVAAALAAGYVLLGAALFRATERWSVLDGCYFSFACLATIGFGELRPGRHASAVSPRAEELALAACCAYILVGIAVIAVCFDLVREDVGAALRALAARGGGGGARVGLGEAVDPERAGPAAAAAGPLEPS